MSFHIPDPAIEQVYRNELEQLLAASVKNKNRSELLRAMAGILQSELVGSGGNGIPCAIEADNMMRIILVLLSGEPIQPGYIREKFRVANRGFDVLCAELEKEAA